MTRVAIVAGIGRAIALHLASDGIDVAIADVESKRKQLDDVVKEVEAKGRKGTAISCDVSQERSVKEMVQTAVDALGGLDIMVANAGIIILGSVLDISDEDFDKVFTVNCKGTLYCYRAAAVQMIKQGRGGRIIGASTSATGIAYSTSKFGVRAITQTAALEWGQHNITVNAYAPGPTDTPMLDLGTAGAAKDAAVEKMMSNAGVKRMGQPEEIAAAVAFLASEGASYITGQTLMVNGGRLLS